MEDSNGRVGNKNISMEKFIGQEGEEILNNNGKNHENMHK